MIEAVMFWNEPNNTSHRALRDSSCGRPHPRRVDTLPLHCHRCAMTLTMLGMAWPLVPIGEVDTGPLTY